MEAQDVHVNPRKRRRRRRQDKPAISAHLLLDERMRGEVGVLSNDLFADLFPAYRQSSGTFKPGRVECRLWLTVSCIGHGSPDELSLDSVFHIAITPWIPTTSIDVASWTIVPVKPAGRHESANRPHSSLQFPAASLALQSFANILHAVAPSKVVQRRDVPLEIRISDVVPLGLDTVYVNLDTNALKKLDEVHTEFGGGFGVGKTNGHVRGPKGKQTQINGTKLESHDAAATQERGWKKAVREALQSPSIVHTGDLLPLPIPSHPITHVPPPPVKVTACEPVSQGLLLPSTRIIIIKSQTHAKSTRILPPVAPPALANGIAEEDEDTSNEMFYSAAEENTLSQAPSPPSEDEAGSATDNFESELSGTDGGDLSDDSEDMISLSAPLLPPQSTGALSSFTSATPQLGGLHTNGIATPGSVFSSFTATTIRGPGLRGRSFEAHGLLKRIPDELIHPKPGSDDDEEARIFVETSALAKIRCFSGDWVKVEASAEPHHPLGSWGLGAFGDEHEEQTEWRAVKIFGLPENLSKKPPRYPVNRNSNRRLSISQFDQPTLAARVYLSPLLLSNLGQPSYLLVSPLSALYPPVGPRTGAQKNKITSNSSPPYAKEVSLLKLATPLSSEITLQPSLFAALKDHFEQKRRIVKSGDLVGITVDTALGRAVFQGSEDNTNDELLAQTKREDAETSRSEISRGSRGVVWFKVDHAAVSGSKEQREVEDQDAWGGVTTIDPAISVLKMGATAQGKVPPAISSSWQYYLGVKSLPMSNNDFPTKAPGIAELPKPYVSSLRRRLRELISAATSPRAIHLGLPPLAILLTSSQRGIGKATTATRACEDLGLHTFTIDSFDIVTEGGAGGGVNKTEATLEMRADRAFHCGAEYTALLIKHIDALNADRMVAALKKVLADSRVLIATTTEVDKVSEGIRGLFTHELELSAPDEAEREGILRGIIEDTGIGLSPSVDLSSVAVKTAALVASDLVDVLDRALVAKRSRLENLVETSNAALRPALPITLKDIQLAGGPASTSLTKPDLDAAVDAARKNFADAIGAPKIPNVSWSDVGGLTHVKDAVMETIQLPLSRPELFAKGMKKRSGILFYGPPGTGKTLLAKAIATEFSLNFFSVKGPELLNMYIGESEANVRRVFQRARDARPCVVFFDELDSVAPKRGNQGDSGGVMDRIVSQLLAELDGMSDGGVGVFVIGATNRPDLLDQALLRPGRFDKMLYLGVSDTHEKQLTILEALTRKYVPTPQKHPLLLPRFTIF